MGGAVYPVYIKISNKEIKQQPPSSFLKDKRLWQPPFQRHIDDKKMTSEGCKSKPPASKVQWKGSKQAKEGGRNNEGPDNLESCTTGGNVHLCLLWKAMHRSWREGAGSSSTCIADTLNFHLFTLTEILFLTGFYQHFYCLRVSGQPRPSFEYILSLSPNQWSFSSSASWMLPLLAFHMYHAAVPLKMTNTVRFKTATHSA